MKITPPGSPSEATPARPTEPSAGDARSVCRTLLKSIGDEQYVRDGLAKLRRSAADAETLRQRLIDFVAQDGASTNRLEAVLPRALPELRELIQTLSADFR